MTMRAAIYARVSSQAQRDRHTIENQLRTLPAYVAGRGWSLVETFIDDGRSARTGELDKRDGFAALLRAAEARRFDVLVVVDVDRLTRTDDLEERARILGPFQRLGITIATPSGGELDMRTMLGELWVTLQAIGAAEENRKRAERIKAGKARAIAEGRKPAGPTPYGYVYSRVTGWAIDPVAAELVREIFRRVADGESCVQIADDFAARGAPTPRSWWRSGWTRATVHRIVRSRAAVGEYEADKARAAVIRIPAIVTEREWQAAQRSLMALRRRGLRRTRHSYLLEGLATCGHCGAPILIRSATSNARRRSRSPAAYICRERKLHQRCDATIVTTAETDARVWAALADEIEQPELLAEVMRAATARASDATDWRADAKIHRAHLGRLERVESAIMVRFRRGSVSEGALDAELAAIGRERAMVARQLEAAERALAASEGGAERLESAAALLARLRAALPSATPDQRRALLRELAGPGGVVIADGRVRLDLRVVLGAEPGAGAPGVDVVRSAG